MSLSLRAAVRLWRAQLRRSAGLQPGTMTSEESDTARAGVVRFISRRIARLPRRAGPKGGRYAACADFTERDCLLYGFFSGRGGGWVAAAGFGTAGFAGAGAAVGVTGFVVS